MMLIHTCRDAAAERGGMVLSRAAFIPIDDILSLDDLRSVATVLKLPWSEGEPLEPIDLATSAGAEHTADLSPIVVAIATALSQDGPRPVVIRQGQGLEEAVFDLWRRAPPEFRINLTFGLSFGPNDVHELSVVCTPEPLIFRWTPAQVIVPSLIVDVGPHAATILDLPARGSAREFAREAGLSLDSPTGISIAVQAFDLWRKPGAPEDDLLLLRTLIDAANKSAGAEAAKSTAAKRVLTSATNWTVENLRVMRNLDFSGLREAQQLFDALELWVKDKACSTQADVLKDVLAAWLSGKPTPLWLKAVETDFRAASDAKMIQKRGFGVIWKLLISETASAARLLSLLVDPAHEKRIMEVIEDSLSVELADALAPKMFAKGWWQLGGVLLARSRAPNEAAKSALAAAPIATASRQALLVGTLSKATDTDLVDAAIDVQDPLVTKIAAQACVRTPSVLKHFDWKRFEWFLLFKEAFDLSSTVWDELPNRQTGLSQTIAAQMAVESLWAAVASTPLANIVEVNERARAWDLIPMPHTVAILNATARGWLEKFEREQLNLTSVEPRLSAVITGIVKQHGYLIAALQRAPGAFMAYLENFGFGTDREVYQFLIDLSQSVLRLDEAAAKALGQLIYARQWRDAAKDAKNLLNTRSDLNPLYRECYSLLGYVDMLWVSYKIGLPSPLTRDQAWEAFETEAAALFSSGPWHDELWSRSGGDPADLSNEGSGRTSWHRCIRSLRNGLAPGVEPVLREMTNQYPYNDTLRQLLQQGFWR